MDRCILTNRMKAAARTRSWMSLFHSSVSKAEREKPKLFTSFSEILLEVTLTAPQCERVVLSYGR
jgi:hypothetical protein